MFLSQSSATTRRPAPRRSVMSRRCSSRAATATRRVIACVTARRIARFVVARVRARTAVRRVTSPRSARSRALPRTWSARTACRVCCLPPPSSYEIHACIQSQPLLTMYTVGHFSRDCPDKEPEVCRNCGEEGHRKNDCVNERVIQCRNCDVWGHTGRDCPQPKDWSRVECSNCKEKGHTFKRCPLPPQEAPAEEEGGDGGW